MNTLRLALRHAASRLARRRAAVLFAALVLAVASVGTVGFFTDRVKGALTRQANVLLGADLLVSGDRPLPDEFAREARARGLAVVPAIRFNSMVQPAERAGGGDAVLADVKAVGAGYPLRGAITLSDATDARGPDGATAFPAPGQVWVDARLAARLDVHEGAKLVVGEATLTVAAIVQQDPEVTGGLFTLGPKLLMNIDDVAATKLLQPGNRATWRLLVAGIRERCVSRLDQAAARARTADRIDPRPASRSAADARSRGAVSRPCRARRGDPRRRCGRAGRVTLSSPPPGCGGDDAVPRRRRTTGAGDVLAAVRRPGRGGKHRGLRARARRAAAARDPARVDGAIRSAAADAAACILRRLPPASRCCWASRCRRWSRSRASRRCACCAATLACRAQAGRWRMDSASRRLHCSSPRRRRMRQMALIMIGGIAALLALAGVIARLLVAAAAIAAAARLQLALRAGQSAPAAARREHADRCAWPRVDGAAAADAGPWRPDANLACEPACRCAHGVPDQCAAGPGRRAYAICSSATWRSTRCPIRWCAAAWSRSTTCRSIPRSCPTSARDASASASSIFRRWPNCRRPTRSLPAGGGRPGKQAACRSRMASPKRSKIKLGDTLTWDFVGTRLSAKVTSLRKVAWDSFRVNFFAVFPPGVLDAMPTTYISAIRVPVGNAAWLTPLLREYPNVLVIDVGEILHQVQSIIEQVARAVEFVFLFTLLGGVLVLEAAIAVTQDERRYDAAILRTLGASQRQLRSAQVTEFHGDRRTRRRARRGRGDDHRLRARRSRRSRYLFTGTRGCGRSASSAARSAWPSPAGSARAARCGSRRWPCCANSPSRCRDRNALACGQGALAPEHSRHRDEDDRSQRNRHRGALQPIDRGYGIATQCARKQRVLRGNGCP